MVYKIRNAIVHNKETEFHLSYYSPHPGVPVLLKEFLFPCLEEMCFALIAAESKLIWYPASSMELFET